MNREISLNYFNELIDKNKILHNMKFIYMVKYDSLLVAVRIL
ncbi:hypothetical protein QUF93_13870 [Bacillus hominis]|nr:hypothetical protein [Bacillus hominis]MDM5193633.1 hypothetical protein [Bacillus hominis]